MVDMLRSHPLELAQFFVDDEAMLAQSIVSDFMEEFSDQMNEPGPYNISTCDWTSDIGSSLPCGPLEAGDHKLGEERNDFRILCAVMIVWSVLIVLCFGAHMNSITFFTKGPRPWSSKLLRCSCAFMLATMAVICFAAGIQLQWKVELDAAASRGLAFWCCVYFIASIVLLAGAFALLLTTGQATQLHDLKKRRRLSRWLQQHPWAGRQSICSTAGLLIAQQYISNIVDPDGDLFFGKLALLEFLEVTIQLHSLMSTAHEEEAGLVLLTALVIATNLILLPVICEVMRRCANNHQRRWTTIAALSMETLFDKLFGGITVFLRQESILDDRLSPFAQLIRHASVLVPVALSFMDTRDILALHDRVMRHKAGESTPRRKRRHNVRRTSLQNALPSGIACLHDTRWNYSRLPCLSLSVVVGCALGTYVTVSFYLAGNACEALIGPVAACSRPRLYYRNGLFGTTTCSFDKVTSMRCAGMLSHRQVELPEAAASYAEMRSLTMIDLSENPGLTRVPDSWGMLPALVKLDLSGAELLAHLPYSLCTPRNTSRSISLSRAACSSSIDWTGELQSGVLSLDSACTDPRALGTSLTGLVLQNNNIVCHYQGRGCTSILDLVLLKGLKHLDLRNNNITDFTSPLVLAVGPIISGGSSMPLNLAGNPVTKMEILSKESDFMAGLFGSVPTFATNLKEVRLTAVPNAAPDQAVVFDTIRSATALTYLQLRGFDISYIRNNSFSSSTQLQVIAFGGVELHHMQACAFCGLPLLSSLGLTANHLQSLDLETLSQLPALKILHLQHNPIREIVWPANPLNLIQLDAAAWAESGANGSSVFPGQQLESTFLRSAPHLTELRLQKNSIRELQPDAFLNSSSLLTLLLYDNQISSLHETNFRHLGNLSHLDLNNNLIRSIPHGAWTGTNRLTYLNLGSNRLIDLGADVFDGLDVLKEVILNSNNLAAPPWLALRSLTKLTRLQLRGNQIQRWSGAPTNMSSLRWLQLGRNNFSAIDSHALANISERLEIVDMHHNLLRRLSSGFMAKLTQLVELNLAYNAISSIGADAFPADNMLQKLNMSGNRLKQIRGDYFSRLLQLTELMLDGNGIVHIDPAALSGLTRLQKLHILHGNPAMNLSYVAHVMAPLAPTIN